MLLLFLLAMSGTRALWAQQSRQDTIPFYLPSYLQSHTKKTGSFLSLRTKALMRKIDDNAYSVDHASDEHWLIRPDFPLNIEEYASYRMQQRVNAFVRQYTQPKEQLSPHSTLLLSIPLEKKEDNDKKQRFIEKILGKGGVQFYAQGSLETTTAIKHIKTDNPILNENAKKRWAFDFDKNIRMQASAKVGEKIKFGMNYDTDATFDFDAKRIKLSYQGNENEVVRNVELGNVNLTTGNSLINTGAALFGIKTDLQFGKLQLSTILSQQEGESRSIKSQRGIQTVPFEMRADEYDENQHFFLGHYFREQYDKAMSKLPFVQSAVSITRMEVWITNKQGDYDKARNIVTFADLGEHTRIHNSLWQKQGTLDVPQNTANTLYEHLLSKGNAMRDFNRISQALPPEMISGIDYEKIESARLLEKSEYRFQSQLGYLSLNRPLQSDEVLAVAFEFSYNGEIFQVGEFSANVGQKNRDDSIGDKNTLFLKLLKPVALTAQSPTWNLMMKNIYTFASNSTSIKSAHFKLHIAYQNDRTGTAVKYLPEAAIKNKQLLRVLALDRLNQKNEPYPDGFFDFIDGYTISAENGQIIFPVIEPFGSHLKKEIADDAIANKYIYQELYDSTLIVARQIPEKNKFIIQGEYKGNSGTTISLNTTNVAHGSVHVTAGGKTLSEGTDYTVNYMEGTVNIINKSIIDTEIPINISLENQSLFGMQRKTMLGLNLMYEFSPNLHTGATLLHYYEKPTSLKSSFNEESVKNTLWGMNFSFRKSSQFLTDIIDKIPFVQATTPSRITANVEFAQLLPGHYRNKYTKGYIYLDDFETSSTAIDLRMPHLWSLASTPYNNTPTGLFPEAALSNNIDYGKNRAHLAWFFIDNMFTHRNSAHTPSHIRNDKQQLSNHLVREVHEREIYPNRENTYMQPTTIPVLNLSYYPNERGAYNLNTDVTMQGFLQNPRKRWGGIMRPLETRDFESANIEYIEFWLMDPFVNDTLQQSNGGDLYFNLGEISEDILKDGYKFFENGLPTNGDPNAVGYSVWGKYPKRQSIVYTFDNSDGMKSRKLQDVGLNGLSSEEEKNYETYKNYLKTLKTKLSAETIAAMQSNPHSPFNDPAGDNFRHFKGVKQDKEQLSILERYKYYNGTEGNSSSAENNGQTGFISRVNPDAEDIDSDNTMNEKEAYYQYKIELKPEKLMVGSNFVVNKRIVNVKLRNGNTENVTWYKFRIPLHQYQTKVGNIQGFNNIRFMRMFLTNFEEPTFLRFATLELVRSEWRTYKRNADAGEGVTIATVNIEENGDQTPVNYVLPPDVSRLPDPSQPQLRQQNEQALSVKIENIEPHQQRAIFKNSMYDLRKYKRLQMFVHAEALENDGGQLKDNDLNLFVRIGSDYQNNYYEYEIPLSITPPKKYNNKNKIDRETVWKADNMLDVVLQSFPQIKLRRNAEMKYNHNISYLAPYSESDTRKPQNTFTVMGNPSLAEIKVIMIGVKNMSKQHQSTEIWLNELRLDQYDENSGWAAQGNMNLALSDIGALSIAGKKETAGFGRLDQGIHDKQNDDFTSIDASLNLDLGRFLPSKAKISVPFYYSYVMQNTLMQYDPYNRDILLETALKNRVNHYEKDSLKNLAITSYVNKSISINNMRINIKSKQPMPYDPSNFSVSYSYNYSNYQNPETEYANNLSYRFLTNYSYSPAIKPWAPFRNINSESEWFKFIQTTHINYLPSNIQFNSHLARNYNETQLRDLHAYSSGQTARHEHHLTFSQHFFWDRDFSFIWDLTRHLKTSFRSGTMAEIEEPYLQVNRKINPSDYEIWKESVMKSICHLGTPLNYEQKLNIAYTLPFSRIPKLNWINAGAAYSSFYRWERGAIVENEQIGNTLQNDRSFTFNSKMNLMSFYNKVPILKATNQLFNRSSYANTKEEKEHRNVGHYLLRGLMWTQNINVNYHNKTRSYIPGFQPMIGDLFGQKQSNGTLMPGLGFAFGFDGGEHFIEKALNNDWLIINKNNIIPAAYHQSKMVKINAILQPMDGLRIDLSTMYEDNRRTEFRYMLEGKPKVYGGSFAISTCMLTSTFENARVKNNYHSAAFDLFRSNRSIIVSRLYAKYQNTPYPTNGFFNELPYAGQAFSKNISPINPSSADVLIPSFVAAYTGKKAEKTTLNFFPKLSSMLPNWDISYNLLSNFPQLRKSFKSILLSHKYISQYRVGNYESFLGWIPRNAESQWGYVRDVSTGAAVPSSPYDISSVSLTESFNPLFEVQTIMDNNLTFNARMNKTRNIHLHISSRQIVETNDNDYVTSLGYRVPDFGRILGINSKNSNEETEHSTYSTESFYGNRNRGHNFSNDLNLRLDVSYKTTRSLIRKIEDGFTQATGGIRTTSILFSADYSFSRHVSLRAFFDKVINKPLVSVGGYSSAITSAGITLRFNLNQ